MIVVTQAFESVLLDAVHLATRKLGSSRKLDDVLPEVLSICIEAVGAEGGTIYLHNRDKKALEFRHVLPAASAEVLKFTDMPDDQGVAGKVFHARVPEISSFESVPESSDQMAKKAGMSVRTMITVPLMLDDTEPIGIVQLINKHDGVFGPDDKTVLETISSVSTLAYLNWQLLDESTRASQLLGMGQVAHDIKNMAFALEANMSYSNETVNLAKVHAEKHVDDPEMLTYIETIQMMIEDLGGSIERVKRYSTLMSDLSAGKALEPEYKIAPLGSTIERAASFLESEGRKHNIQIKYEIQADAPPMKHDDMYIFRIVQNLVSNALKAVAETAHEDVDELEQVTVHYRFEDGSHVLEVEDTGPGMTEETANKILKGSARSVWAKSSGSGWGTKIVLELAATHQGIVSISSELGKGSIFRIKFPG
jgi:signal transduction histidine kinase